MDALVVGSDKTPILEYLRRGRGPFLFIDHGPLIDTFAVPAHPKPAIFDVKKQRLNPLDKIDYRRTREFISVLNAVFPEGQNTLTKKNAISYC